ncbi:MAG: carboxypeptidase-like regulatory domain-containing protein [Planctomycetota bacterium]
MTSNSTRPSRVRFFVIFILIIVAAAVLYYLIDSGSSNSPVANNPEISTNRPDATIHETAKAETASRTAATAEKVPASANTKNQGRSSSEIFGIVTDAAGAPINDAQIFLYQDSALIVNSQTTSDAQGKYKIASPPLGEVRIYCIKERFCEQRKPLTIEKTGGAVRCDFVLQSTSLIKVFVKLKNAAAPDADPQLIEQLLHNWNVTSVIATRERPPATIPIAMHSYMNPSFGIGNYYFSGSPEAVELVYANGQPDASFHGVLEVKSQLPIFVSIIISGRVVETRFIDTSVESLEFYLHPDDLRATLGSIEFTIIDKDTQAPITSADVIVSQFRRGPRGVRPDANGKVNIQNLAQGAWNIELWSRQVYGVGYPDRFFYVNVAPKKVTQLGIIELGRTTTIRGTIVDPQGYARGGIYGLHAIDPRSINWVLSEGRMSVAVDIRGNFECKNILGGMYVITLGDYRLDHSRNVSRQSWFIDTNHNSGANLKLEVRPGRPVRIIYDFDEVTQYVAILKDSNGACLFDREIAHEGAIGMDLAAGNYQLFLYTNFDTFKKIDFTVKNEPVTIRIDK